MPLLKKEILHREDIVRAYIQTLLVGDNKQLTHRQVLSLFQVEMTWETMMTIAGVVGRTMRDGFDAINDVYATVDEELDEDIAEDEALAIELATRGTDVGTQAGGADLNVSTDEILMADMDDASTQELDASTQELPSTPSDTMSTTSNNDEDTNVEGVRVERLYEYEDMYAPLSSDDEMSVAPVSSADEHTDTDSVAPPSPPSPISPLPGSVNIDDAIPPLHQSTPRARRRVRLNSL